MASKSEMDALLQTIESEFSPNDFIAEMEARPAIWNHTDPMYTKQACKKASWDSLIRKYHTDIDTRLPAEQSLIGAHYRRKWKSFRDSFARELSKIKNSTKPRKTKYMYFQQLSFLLSMRGVPSSNIDDVESYLYDVKNDHYEDDDSNNNDNTFSNSINNNFIKPEPDFSLYEIQQPDITDNNTNNNTSSPFQQHAKKKHRKSNSPDASTYVMEDDDEDRLFLLSLLSELRRVPSVMKLDVKCDLLNVFKHARSQYLSNNDDNNIHDNNIHENDATTNNIDKNVVTNGNTNNNHNNNDDDDDNGDLNHDNNNSYNAFNNNNIFSGDDNDAYNGNSNLLNNNRLNNNNFIHS